MAEEEKKISGEDAGSTGKTGAKEEREYVWPALVFKEYLAAMAVVIVLIVLSLLINAPLKEMANPGITENPAKAAWYFLGLQELLVYFDPWFAGVLLPSLIITGLLVIPYIDKNPKGSGGYAFSLRKFAIFNFLFGFIMWWVLIFIGTFLRGPNWAFYWPWESWEVHKAVEEKLVNIPGSWGLIFLGLYFLLGMILPRFLSKRFLGKIGFLSYVIVMAHLLLMYLVPIKIVLRLAFRIRYVLITPWFNI